jgi:hypothetical protein
LCVKEKKYFRRGVSPCVYAPCNSSSLNAISRRCLSSVSNLTAASYASTLAASESERMTSLGWPGFSTVTFSLVLVILATIVFLGVVVCTVWVCCAPPPPPPPPRGRLCEISTPRLGGVAPTAPARPAPPRGVLGNAEEDGRAPGPPGAPPTAAPTVGKGDSPRARVDRRRGRRARRLSRDLGVLSRCPSAQKACREELVGVSLSWGALHHRPPPPARLVLLLLGRPRLPQPSPLHYSHTPLLFSHDS